MTSVDKVKRVCKERKIPISKIERDLGFANGYIGQLRKGVLPDDRLVAIAAYLNLPVEYFLSGTKNTEPTTVADDELSDDQRLLIEKLLAMSPEELEKKLPAIRVILEL